MFNIVIVQQIALLLLRWIFGGGILSYYPTCCYCLLFIFFILFSAVSVCLSLVNEPSWPQPFLIIWRPRSVVCVHARVCVCVRVTKYFVRAERKIKTTIRCNNNFNNNEIIRSPPNLQRHVAIRHHSDRLLFYIDCTRYLLVFVTQIFFFLLSVLRKIWDAQNMLSSSSSSFTYQSNSPHCRH